MKRKYDEAEIIAMKIIKENPLYKKMKKNDIKTSRGVGRDGKNIIVDITAHYDYPPKEKNFIKDIPGLCALQVVLPDDSEDYKIEINPYNDPRFEELKKLLDD